MYKHACVHRQGGCSAATACNTSEQARHDKAAPHIIAFRQARLHLQHNLQLLLQLLGLLLLDAGLHILQQGPTALHILGSELPAATQHVTAGSASASHVAGRETAMLMDTLQGALCVLLHGCSTVHHMPQKGSVMHLPLSMWQRQSYAQRGP